MRKIMVIVTGVIFVCAALGYAQTTANETMTLKGDIVDNMCAGNQTPQQLVEFVKSHTKTCALAPECAASGYLIFAEGKIFKFDDASNIKIQDFLMKKESKLQVVVTAKKSGEKLRLVTIENQK